MKVDTLSIKAENVVDEHTNIVLLYGKTAIFFKKS
jgi:hypothetical protein